MKEENLLDITNAVVSLHPSPEAVATQEVMLQEMQAVCCVYTEDFQNLHETYGLQGGEDLGESADLFLCDLPYNVHRQRDLQNSDHNVFKATDLESFCEIADYVLKREGHGHIFCSAVQFATLGKAFLRSYERGLGRY